MNKLTLRPNLYFLISLNPGPSLSLQQCFAGTVHSKCSSTGSACPVAIGHRDSIQQEMLKERHSDLLGELCLFASVVPLPGFSLALRPWVRGMVSIVPSPPTCSQLHSTGPWGKGSVKTVEILHDTELVFRTWTTSPIALQHCTTLEGAHWCVACVNSVKDHLKQACYGRAWGATAMGLPLSLTVTFKRS